MKTRIADIRAEPLSIPLKEPFAISLSTLTAITNVKVEVVLEDGTTGLGEAAPWRELTGETQATVLAIVNEARDHWIGRDAREIRPLSRILEQQYGSQASARAGLEIALYDAVSRSAGLSLHQFLGGGQSRFEIDVTISMIDPGRARELARHWTEAGFRTIKVKVGGGLEEDLARVRAIRQAAPGAQLILDANQGYSAHQALRFLERLESETCVPVLLEQPVPESDIRGLAEVARESPVPVAADESARSSQDVLRLAEAGACDVINIKLMKCGGITRAMDMAAIARSAHLGLMIGGMLESRIGMNAAAHLAAGLGGFTVFDLDTHMFLEEDPFEGGFHQEGPHLSLDPERPGAGVVPRTGGGPRRKRG